MSLGFFFIPSFFKINKKQIDTHETPHDRESLELLNTYVTRWMITNRFLYKNGNDYRPNIDPKNLHGTIPSHIYTLNFKRLCIDAHLQDLLIRLKDTEHDRTTTRLIDLHILIMTDIDPRFLNLYISKLIYTLKHLYPDDVVDHDWEDLFHDMPYLWLIYVIQNIMRQFTPIPI